MEEILRRDDLGRVARSMAPSDIAQAIVEILDRPTPERDAWRRRIQAAARERYTWPVAAAAYRRVIDGLRPGAMGR
jgi:glycosyltransferase involved in cell wall biosynthesis